MCENVGISDVEKISLEDAPTNIQEQLRKWKIGRGNLTHCIMTLDADEIGKSSCASERMVSRYCWFGGMDDKGSVPKHIKDVVYLLDMTSKFYDNTRFGLIRDSENTFTIHKADPFSAHTLTEKRACFHKIILEGEIKTIPLLKMRIYIDQATVTGDIDKHKFLAFLVLEVPITFDLEDAIERSCNRMGSDKRICDEMKTMWVQVASAQEGFSAYGQSDKEKILNITFKVTLCGVCF